MLRKLLAALAVAASATLFVSGGTAGAEEGPTIRVLLTPEERETACGSFQGDIIFSDGSALDCYSGIAKIPAA